MYGVGVGGGGNYDGGGGNASSLFGGGGFMPSQATNAAEGTSGGGGGFPKVLPLLILPKFLVCLFFFGYLLRFPRTDALWGSRVWSESERPGAAPAHREADHGRVPDQRRQVEFCCQWHGGVHGIDLAYFCVVIGVRK